MDFSRNISLLRTFRGYSSPITIYSTNTVSICPAVNEKSAHFCFLFRWERFFKSRLAKAFSAGAIYYFNFIICVFGLLFLGKIKFSIEIQKKNKQAMKRLLDSIRELRKYAAVEVKDSLIPHAEVNAHMKQFRSQRNFYIAGFALFLWL